MRRRDEVAARSMTDRAHSEYVKRLVDQAPPLTADQRARLAILLAPALATTKAKRERLATIEEVAEYLGKTVNSLYVMRHRGTGPRSSKVGRTVRYRWSDVEKWLDEQARTVGRRKRSAGAGLLGRS